MGTRSGRISDYLRQLFESRSEEELAARLDPRADPSRPKIPKSRSIDPETVGKRWDVLGPEHPAKGPLLDPQTVAQMASYARNIENFVGTVKVPVGVAGPLRVNGLFAHGDYYVPLATTEAALVASYSRGAQLITECGGCAATLLNEGVSRASGFAFRSLKEAGQFVAWVTAREDELARIAESTTRWGKVVDTRVSVDGNHVYVELQMTTGEASGQNMVTIAAQAVGEHIEKHSPVRPEYGFVEANMSGDKKASSLSFQTVRGKKVSAEVVVPGALVERRLHTSATRIADYWRMSAVGGMLSGIIGHQGHYANGLAALYIACGQDAACVAESAVGMTRLEVTDGTDLYASVTLPNVMVGTVGGGTGLPTQKACLDLLGLSGPDSARALAEVCAGLALAGELSITGALCAGEFVRAHKTLARGPA
jgi:hydroxymethylglutaryl-CoA reductase (NADPH)